MSHLSHTDPEIAALLNQELHRQQNSLELIPSENFVSPAVLEALGSVLTNKYSEGYAGARYYGGNEYVDQIERLAIERAKHLFGADHVNIQPYSGSPANHAAYLGLLNPGDKILGMGLPYGGHLTHGWKVSFSAKYYTAVSYPTNEDGWLDYEKIAEIAQAEKPRLIICGGSAYSRVIDFAKFRQIADSVGAYLMADIAHIAGLVAGGAHPSPIPYADVVTTTLHKTLRGPRGAMIMCRAEHASAIDKAVFPGLQGGPHNHVTAAAAVTFHEAASPAFADYARQTVDNAQTLAETLKAAGLSVVTGGTDTHLMLVDVTPFDLTGAQAETLLDSIGVTVNKNMIPFDPRKPMDPSGIRVGTPAITTRGLGEHDIIQLGGIIAQTLKHPTNEDMHATAHSEVRALCEKHPLYTTLSY